MNKRTRSFPKKSVLFYCAMFFIVFILVFCIAEIFVRFNFYHYDLWSLTGRSTGRNYMEKWALIDAFCAYRAKPGTYGITGKSVNSYGFISTPEISPTKPDNTIRIAFLGGSSTAGTGFDLPDEETWPWKVIKILREKCPKIRFDFINAALGGYTSFESYGRLWSRIRFFFP